MQLACSVLIRKFYKVYYEIRNRENWNVWTNWKNQPVSFSFGINSVLESPRICGGLKGLRVLKTTQSSFTDFIQDEYRTLPDMNDRIFSTVVTATWDFSTATGVDFDNVWYIVKDCIMQKFAGPPDTGIYSPSVQNTLYLAEKDILDKVKQVSINIHLLAYITKI